MWTRSPAAGGPLRGLGRRPRRWRLQEAVVLYHDGSSATRTTRFLGPCTPSTRLSSMSEVGGGSRDERDRPALEPRSGDLRQRLRQDLDDLFLSDDADVQVGNERKRSPALGWAAREHDRAGLGDRNGAAGESTVDPVELGRGQSWPSTRSRSAARQDDGIPGATTSRTASRAAQTVVIALARSASATPWTSARYSATRRQKSATRCSAASDPRASVGARRRQLRCPRRLLAEGRRDPSEDLLACFAHRRSRRHHERKLSAATGFRSRDSVSSFPSGPGSRRIEPVRTNGRWPRRPSC